MSSIRCKQCNLVNFSTEIQCKRCGQPLNDYAPFTDERSYQETPEQNYQPQQYSNQNQPTQYQSYQMPPPPSFYSNDYQPQQMMQMSCIKCGNGNNVSLQNFKKEYVPPLAYFALVLGLLPGAIIISLIKVTHLVNAPFCHECWGKFRKVNLIETLTTIGALVGFIVAIFIGILAKSLFVFLLFVVAILVMVVYGQRYRVKNSPKFKKVNRKEVVIKDPRFGDVSFAR